MLNNLINENSEAARLDFHHYITEKVRSMMGFSQKNVNSEDAENLDEQFKATTTEHIYTISCDDPQYIHAIDQLDAITMETNNDDTFATVYVDQDNEAAIKAFSELMRTKKTRIGGELIDISKCNGVVKKTGTREVDITRQARPMKK